MFLADRRAVQVTAATTDRTPSKPGERGVQIRDQIYSTLAFHFTLKGRKALDCELLRAEPNTVQLGTPNTSLTETQDSLWLLEKDPETQLS